MVLGGNVPVIHTSSAKTFVVNVIFRCYDPTIVCNLIRGLQCWIHEQMLIGSNPSRVRIFFTACYFKYILLLLLLLLLLW
jgi:hypothetical protein